MKRVSVFPIRFFSILFILLAGLWIWATYGHGGSWWWAAALNVIPPQVLLPLPMWLAWRAGRAKKRGWVILNVLVALIFLVKPVGLVLPHAEAGHVGIPLTVLTLNANFASADPARIAELAAQQGAEVVTLQEGLDQNGQAGVFEAGLRAAFPGWTIHRHDELLTVTKLPILRTQVIPFPNTPHAVLLVQVRSEGQPVTVVNTHLPTLSVLPNTSDKALGRTLQERMEHGLDLRRDFGQVVGQILKSTSGPLILAGDLNAPPRGGVYWQLRHLGLQDAFAEVGVGFGFTHHAWLPHSRIDYIWTRDAQAEQAAPLRAALSDHRALVVRLRLPTP